MQQHPDKKSLRAHFLAERARHSDPAEVQTRNAALCGNLAEFFASRAGGLWAAYRAMPGEASIDGIIDELRMKGLNFCFPRILDADRGLMDFFLATKESDFERHVWGMLEPKESCQIVPKEKIVGAFVPLLAFDAQGTRLGKGRAFYDRYLANFAGKKIGIAFEWQRSTLDIPREAHDVHLSAVITDKGIHRFPT